MTKSATGTEYVNAQTEELKTKINELAGKINGTMLGLIYTKLYVGTRAYIHVMLLTDIYYGEFRCRLVVHGGQWNGSETVDGRTVSYYGSMSISEKIIPEGFRPQNDMSQSEFIYWRAGTPGSGTVNLSLSAGGMLQVTIDGSGYVNHTFGWIL